MNDIKVINVVVIIVTYKSADLTIDCLQSIQNERNSDLINIHVVVVDNASGDADSVQHAVNQNQWTDWVSVVTAPKNGGFAYGNNYGFYYAMQHHEEIDFFHLLNPDTLVRSGAISELVRFLSANPNVGIAGSSFDNLDGSLWPIAFRFPTPLGHIHSRLLNRFQIGVQMEQIEQPIDWIAGASMMITRSAVEKLKGFDDGYFLYYEETDLCLRAKRMGIETWYVPTSKVMHIAGQSTKLTERDAKPKRLPAYWFESRRRYFVINHGVVYSVFVDLAVIFSGLISKLKSILKAKQDDEQVPYFLIDTIKYSAFFSRNRKVSPFSSIFLKSE